ncbi:hypothetical protein BV908_18445 [Diaphorobacter sp. LR2014-1]|nr:hypothetical protein BV908_18445 [Diaphorobacter sp. LR2014-1]
MRACDAALQVLIETDNPSVMYGDEWLCHQIAARLGWEHAGPATTRRVLRALSKTPGRLVKGLIRMPGDCCARGQSALHFELPEPEHAFMMGFLRQGKKPDWSTFNKR